MGDDLATAGEGDLLLQAKGVGIWQELRLSSRLRHRRMLGSLSAGRIRVLITLPWR